MLPHMYDMSIHLQSIHMCKYYIHHSLLCPILDFPYTTINCSVDLVLNPSCIMFPTTPQSDSTSRLSSDWSRDSNVAVLRVSYNNPKVPFARLLTTNSA